MEISSRTHINMCVCVCICVWNWPLSVFFHFSLVSFRSLFYFIFWFFHMFSFHFQYFCLCRLYNAVISRLLLLFCCLFRYFFTNLFFYHRSAIIYVFWHVKRYRPFSSISKYATIVCWTMIMYENCYYCWKWYLFPLVCVCVATVNEAIIFFFAFVHCMHACMCVI